MAGEIEDSVTVWIASLKAGDADAAQKLWQRYFETLVRLAPTGSAVRPDRGRRGRCRLERLRQLRPRGRPRTLSPAR